MQFKNKHNKTIKQTIWLKKCWTSSPSESDSWFFFFLHKIVEIHVFCNFFNPLKALVVQYFLKERGKKISKRTKTQPWNSVDLVHPWFLLGGYWEIFNWLQPPPPLSFDSSELNITVLMWFFFQIITTFVFILLIIIMFLSCILLHLI